MYLFRKKDFSEAYFKLAKSTFTKLRNTNDPCALSN